MLADRVEEHSLHIITDEEVKPAIPLHDDATTYVSFAETVFGRATTAFVASVITHVGDDVTFKLVCNAFPGRLFMFVSTVNPLLLAGILIMLTLCFSQCHLPRRHKTADEPTVPGSNCFFASSHILPLPPWFRPQLSHVAIAVLDQLVILLATAGGSNTPGYAQVILNQSKLPLTAIFSGFAFGRRYTRFQTIAAALIVTGSVFVSTGALAEPTDDHNQNDNDNGQIPLRS